MTIVTRGDYARLRGGGLVWVSSAVDQNSPEVIDNPDDLFLGYPVKYSSITDSYFVDKRKLVVDTMQEVVAIEMGIVVR